MCPIMSRQRQRARSTLNSTTTMDPADHDGLTPLVVVVVDWSRLPYILVKTAPTFWPEQPSTLVTMTLKQGPF